MSVRFLRGDGAIAGMFDDVAEAIAPCIELVVEPTWRVADLTAIWLVPAVPVLRTAGASGACGGMSLILDRLDDHTYKARAIHVCADCYLDRMPLATAVGQ